MFRGIFKKRSVIGLGFSALGISVCYLNKDKIVNNDLYFMQLEKNRNVLYKTKDDKLWKPMSLKYFFTDKKDITALRLTNIPITNNPRIKGSRTPDEFKEMENSLKMLEIIGYNNYSLPHMTFKNLEYLTIKSPSMIYFQCPYYACDCLENLSNLKELTLYNTHIYSISEYDIYKMKSLKKLDFRQNKYLGKLFLNTLNKNIEYIILQGNSITDLLLPLPDYEIEKLGYPLQKTLYNLKKLIFTQSTDICIGGYDVICRLKQLHKDTNVFIGINTPNDYLYLSNKK